MKELRFLQQLREKYSPILPEILKDMHAVVFDKTQDIFPTKSKIKDLFPLTSNSFVLKARKKSQLSSQKSLRVGVVFSGGPAPGGHNVISGLYDALKSLNPRSQLFGFFNGPSGIYSGKYQELTEVMIDPYRNQGGFDLIGSGRAKIESEEHLLASLETMRSMKLDGLVIIGGDDSNTNAAILAEYFLKNECPVKVIGVPKTIDGDLKNPFVATSFGFDTACKVYSELIGNIARDALSSKKYYHFIRLMGRSASHIALECALATKPNLTLIGEEVALEKKTLRDLVEEISDLICQRSEIGKNFGVILIPEGLIEFIPEMGSLIKELSSLLMSAPEISMEQLAVKLSPAAFSCFSSLSQEIQKQLLLNRDAHGNVQVSFIETEKLFIQMVCNELSMRQKKGDYKGNFNAISHFLGYEGRSAFPSNFDCNYCYALGYTAALLVKSGLTGYMCSVQELTLSPTQWQVGAVPLTALLDIEMRNEKQKPVIKKALVDLNGKAFSYLRKHCKEWEVDDLYLYPGPIQYFGPPSLCDKISVTLFFESIYTSSTSK